MRYLLVVLASSCGPPSAVEPVAVKPPQITPSSELSTALSPLAWLLGDWTGAAGSQHWIAAGGAIYGVGFHGDQFDVRIIDDGEGGGPPDGVLRLITMEGGKTSIESRQQVVGDLEVSFEKGETLKRTGDTLAIGTGRFARDTRQAGPELEVADRAFAADTAKRGADGWVAAFDPRGGMMRRGQRVEHGQIAETMKPTLSSGTLAWDPVASGKSGELGFTVGKAVFTAATPEAGWQSSYVTIWRKQADATWKVLFDTGRQVQKAAR